MKTMLIMFFAALWLWAGSCQAERVKIESAVLGETRDVDVMRPRQYDGHSRLPVLYVLDGEQHGKLIAEVVHAGADNARIPPMIVVAVHNGGGGVEDRRERDLVPYRDDWAPHGGGAAAFQRFLRDELVPHIDKAYAGSGFNVLVGKSYGGLFCLYSALQPGSPFSAYVVASPSVFLKDGQMVRDIWQGRARFEGLKYLFLSHANEDDILRKPAVEIAGILRQRMGPGRFDFSQLMAERHESVLLPTVQQALAKLFEQWPLPTHVERYGLPALLEHYDGEIERLGLGIDVPERLFVLAGNLISSSGNASLALPVYLEAEKRFPASVAVEFALYRAYAKAKGLGAARRHLELAVAAAEAVGDPDLAELKVLLATLPR